MWRVLLSGSSCLSPGQSCETLQTSSTLRLRGCKFLLALSEEVRVFGYEDLVVYLLNLVEHQNIHVLIARSWYFFNLLSLSLLCL